MLPSVTPDQSALAISRPSITPNDPMSNPTEKVCDYCRKQRHIKEFCWKLHGRPKGRGGKSTSACSQAHMSEESDCSPIFTPDSFAAFTPDQIMALQRMFSQQQLGTFSTGSSPSGPSDDSSNLAKSGITPSAFSASLSSGLSWLLDSGANKHMTSSPELFDSYIPCSGKDKIRVADSSLSFITGKWSVSCTPTISLNYVLHVPNLYVNLLSIFHLTLELNCCVIFFSSHCVFQELGTEKVIGFGRVRDGLYYLDPPLAFAHAPRTDNSLLHQWHQRLGHPSFRVLSILFLQLTKGCNGKFV
ncbi:hypothetical protein CFOL_v3_10296 [Cephalotus follicularis]|uniref:Retrovirus-related Pol polyprotein from transposon TNT 1-94-like beta-barrel domain-containing protein n=1 Tax=Cephalotus follicularis TaxID=3775 RepID=A0A1Q3BFI2_CEPFO|nr:hypothetical protein CFOL_v3_10296 [Cephalotus follicularis]